MLGGCPCLAAACARTGFRTVGEDPCELRASRRPQREQTCGLPLLPEPRRYGQPAGGAGLEPKPAARSRPRAANAMTPRNARARPVLVSYSTLACTLRRDAISAAGARADPEKWRGLLLRLFVGCCCELAIAACKLGCGASLLQSCTGAAGAKSARQELLRGTQRHTRRHRCEQQCSSDGSGNSRLLRGRFTWMDLRQ